MNFSTKPFCTQFCYNDSGVMDKYVLCRLNLEPLLVRKEWYPIEYIFISLLYYMKKYFKHIKYRTIIKGDMLCCSIFQNILTVLEYVRGELLQNCTIWDRGVWSWPTEISHCVSHFTHSLPEWDVMRSLQNLTKSLSGFTIQSGQTKTSSRAPRPNRHPIPAPTNDTGF